MLQCLFGRSNKAICLFLSCTTSVFVVIAVAAVILGRTPDFSTTCSTICPCINDNGPEVPPACSFSVSSSFSFPVLFFGMICVILQIFALAFSLFYFFYNAEKAFIATYIFIEIPFAIFSQSLWAYILVDIGSEQSIRNFSLGMGGAVLPNALQIVTEDFSYFVCEADYPIRPSFAVALMFALLAYIFSIIATAYYYFFAATLEGPTLSDYFTISLRRIGSVLRVANRKANVLEEIQLKVKLQNQLQFQEISLPGEKSIDTLLQVIASKFEIDKYTIESIFKDGNILISTGSDVQNLQHGDELHVIISDERYLDLAQDI